VLLIYLVFDDLTRGVGDSPTLRGKSPRGWSLAITITLLMSSSCPYCGTKSSSSPLKRHIREMHPDIVFDGVLHANPSSGSADICDPLLLSGSNVGLRLTVGEFSGHR